MAKETKEDLEKKLSEMQKEATEKMIAYCRLSKLLFDAGDNTPYNINELKEDSEFFKPATALCEELEIDWKNMTHEESNRIMLSLLDDYFNAINVDGDFKFTLQVTATPKPKK